MSDGGHGGGHGAETHSGGRFRIPWRYVLPALVISIPILIYLAPELMAFIVAVIGFFAPLWLPALLVWFAWPVWLTFARSHYVASVPYSTIELKPGPETPRTARAMELVFYSLHHRTEVTRVSKYLMGHVRVPWAFEVMAHAGFVRFFVHLPTAHREAVESRIRSEYRDIDIDQVRDYSREIPYDPYRMKLHMREYNLTKPDPYPLKTYTAYEEAKSDKFLELLEGLLDVGEEEYFCISFIVRPHHRERKGLFETESTDSLHEDAHHEIVKLLGHKGDIHAVSPKVKATIAAIEAALKKPSFDCGIRAMYVAPREKAREDAEERLDSLFNRFSDGALNGFASYHPIDNIKWPMSEAAKAIAPLQDAYFMQLYRRRAFFAPPYYGRRFVLNTEELATLFHIPHYARASALAALRGVQLEPPANLPV